MACEISINDGPIALSCRRREPAGSPAGRVGRRIRCRRCQPGLIELSRCDSRRAACLLGARRWFAHERPDGVAPAIESPVDQEDRCPAQPPSSIARCTTMSLSGSSFCTAAIQPVSAWGAPRDRTMTMGQCACSAKAVAVESSCMRARHPFPCRPTHTMAASWDSSFQHTIGVPAHDGGFDLDRSPHVGDGHRCSVQSNSACSASHTTASTRGRYLFNGRASPAMTAVCLEGVANSHGSDLLYGGTGDGSHQRQRRFRRLNRFNRPVIRRPVG